MNSYNKEKAVYRGMPYLITCVLIVILTSNVFGTTFIWQGASSNLWLANALTNWAQGGLYPSSTDDVKITHKPTTPRMPTIATGNAYAATLYVGVDWASPSQSAILTVNSGTLTVSTAIQVGYTTTTVGVTDVLNMNGGTITAPFINVGHLGKGVLNMSAGTINLTGQFKVPSSTGTGSGTVNLVGGAIYADGLYMQSTGYMNITGGKLVLNSDAGIQGYISSGWIKSYGGDGQVIVDTVMNPGKSTVYAVEMETKAYNPNPYQNAANVSWAPTLGWSAGAGSIAHDVYMGEDANSLVQVANHQSEKFYNVTTNLKFSTKYYWRVDEWDGSVIHTGDLWYFTTARENTTSPFNIAEDIDISVLCPAYDLDNNCHINFKDLELLLTSWLAAPIIPDYDLNSDSNVDLQDFALLASEWLGGLELDPVISGSNIARCQTYTASSNSSAAYQAFDSNSSTYWQGSSYSNQSITISFTNTGVVVNRARLYELDDSTTSFSLSYQGQDNAWHTIGTYGCIGDSGSPRIVAFPKIFAKQLTLTYISGIGTPKLCEFEAYEVLVSRNLACDEHYDAATNPNTAYLACDSNRQTYWQGDVSSVEYGNQYVLVDFGRLVTFNKMVLSEVGGTTSQFAITYLDKEQSAGNWKTAIIGTSIGSPDNPTNFTCQSITARMVAVDYIAGNGTPKLCEFQLYKDAEAVNLGRGQVYAAKTNSSTAYKASDGVPSTYWEGDTSTYTYPTQYVTIDFNQPTYVNKVRLSEVDGTTTSYAIAYYDGLSWHSAATGTAIGTKDNPTVLIFDTILAEVIALDYNGGSGNPRLSEFEAYYDQKGSEPNVGYLIDEGFNPSDVNTQPGWVEGFGVGGTLSYWAPGFMIWLNDTSNTNGVCLSKNFPPQSSGTTLTWEFTFRLKDSVFDGPLFIMGGEGKDSVILKANLGKLCYVRTDRSLLNLGTLTSNLFYSIKIIADISTNAVDIYFDGVKKTPSGGLPFSNSCGRLDHIYMGTQYYGIGTLGLTNVRVHKGYMVNEDLVCATVSSVLAPDDWYKTTTGGQVGVQNMVCCPSREIGSFKLNDTSNSYYTSLQKSFTATDGDVVFEYKFMLPTKQDGVESSLLSDSSEAIKIITYNGNICYRNSTGSDVSVWPNYKANVWYHIKLIAHIQSDSSDTADIYVNRQKRASGSTVFCNASSIVSVNSIKFQTSSLNTGVMWLDNIKVRPVDNLLGFHQVPKPNPIDTGEYCVGAQYMPAWREGSLGGWKSFDRTPWMDHKPLLGWYDEGSPYIADWEIKYALEHGINHMMFDWYRSGMGETLKDPYLCHALEAYLDSKYIDMFKFTIQSVMHENPPWYPITDANDMYINLLPYWIEYYFKHPSYLKTSDNKPIMGMYEPLKLVGALGSTSAVNTMLDQMRQQCINEGFGGLILLAEYRGTDQGIISQLIECGFDYIYQYAYHPNGDVGEDVAMQFQRDTLNAQREIANGNIGIAPAVGMGWNPIWGGTWPTSYRLSPSNYKTQCLWVKNTFGAPVIDPAGHKLVLLDNWNEYSEGHYISPTAGTGSLNPNSSLGFGYVDAVLESFSGSNEKDYTNVVPGTIELEWLYPFGW